VFSLFIHTIHRNYCLSTILTTLGVDFSNILKAASLIPKAPKDTGKGTILLRFWNLCEKKLPLNMLVKSTQEGTMFNHRRLNAKAR